MRFLSCLFLVPVFALACSSSDDTNVASVDSAGGSGGSLGPIPSGGSGAISAGGTGGVGGTHSASAGGSIGGASGSSALGGTSSGGDAGAAGEGGSAGDGGASSGNGGSAGDAGTSGSSGSSGQGGETGGTDGFVIAPHAPLPILQAHGNKTLPAPELVTVTFPGYIYKSQAADFAASVSTSSWMTTVGESYGIGAATNVKAVELPDAAPATINDSDLRTLLIGRVNDGTLPPVTDNTIYIIYTPAGMKVVDDSDGGGASCTEFWGYHGAATAGTKALVYAIITDCAGEALADVTSTAAHEIAEAATDPTDGYWYQGNNNNPWAWIDDGTECADLCEYYPNVTIDGFAYQRVWSNSAAKAATSSPCLPLPTGDVYHNVSPDKLTLQTVKPGASVTFTLTGWSTAEVADWTIASEPDSTGAYNDNGDLVGFSPQVKFSSNKINNGKTVTVTLTAPAATPSGRVGVVKIKSDSAGGQFWPIGIETN